jgi:hypothetical protein
MIGSGQRYRENFRRRPVLELSDFVTTLFDAAMMGNFVGVLMTHGHIPKNS